jgi:hypothetical protein
MKRRIAAGLAGLFFVAAAGTAGADTLFTLPQTTPDISSAQLVISYDAGTHVLDVTGNAVSLNTPALSFPSPILDSTSTTNGSFHLSALVGNDGTLLSHTAELTIIGTPLFDSSVAGTLFHSVTLDQFGSGPDKAFQFVFSGNDGTIGTPGGKIGVKLFAELSNPAISVVANDPSFLSGFTTIADGQADSFAIPVPTPAAAAGGLGLLGLFAAKRGLRRKS